MSAIVKNIKSIAKAAKRELGEFQKGWQEAEEYWREHPQDRIHDFQF